MRIVTRPDFDGIVCAVLLREALHISQPVKWVEPSDVQRGLAEIRKGDILANLPYDEKCTLWFDHHYTNRVYRKYRGVFRIAPSAAGLIFEHYQNRLKRDYRELVVATDKIDSADLTLDEVLHPERYDYVLLSMTVFDGDQDGELYWNKLVDLIGRYSFDQVLADSEVKRRCRAVVEKNNQYLEYLKKFTRLDKNVSITDFRTLPQTPVGNRFLVYSLFPESVVNVRIRYEDRNREIVVVNVGHSIFKRTCEVNVGLLLAEFGGGGHRGAGSARIPKCKAQEGLSRIIETLQENKSNEN
jgi:oligoribonuclease NrnB/cAMP/cGMP phosphodiesterase (DHH superfamily)